MSETATTEAPATVPVEITSRWDNARVLFRAEVDASIPLFGRIKAAVLLALKQKASLRDADLRGANLGGANLGGANLGDADLHGAYLRDAYLRDAYLRGANLGGANLGDAYLRGANLHGANLRGAYLHGANLHGANLGGANLGGAKIRLSNGTEILLAAGRSVLSIGPIGSEGGTLLIYRDTDGDLHAQRGCFGPAPMSEFMAAVDEKHGAGPHGVEYRAAVTMAQAWGSAA